MITGVSDGVVDFHASPGNTTGGSNGTTGQNPLMSVTPRPGSASIIPGYNDTPRPPTATATKATPKPTPKASGNIGLLGGIALSKDTIQLILAAAIAVVIAVMIIYFFSNLSKLTGKKKAEKPAARPPDHRKSPKPEVKSEAPTLPKKPEEVTQDYIYGLVMGQAEKSAERPPVQPQNEYKKKR